MTGRAGRGACQVCLCRYPLLKLGGYAIGQHRDRRDPKGGTCAGSNRQPIARTVRWSEKAEADPDVTSAP